MKLIFRLGVGLMEVETRTAEVFCEGWHEKSNIFLLYPEEELQSESYVVPRLAGYDVG